MYYLKYLGVPCTCVNPLVFNTVAWHHICNIPDDSVTCLLFSCRFVPRLNQIWSADLRSTQCRCAWLICCLFSRVVMWVSTVWYRTACKEGIPSLFSICKSTDLNFCLCGIMKLERAETGMTQRNYPDTDLPEYSDCRCMPY